MDKFGIFKLLNSFYDYYEKNKSAPKSAPHTQENAKNDAPAVWSAPKNNGNGPAAPRSAAPLQNTMLSTMSSHDDFVKRVLKNNREK